MKRLLVTGAVAVLASASVVAGAPVPARAGPLIGNVSFVGSIDTMKLSKDQAGGGFTSGDQQAVNLIAQTSATHITVDTPIEDTATLVAWANAIHNAGKSVWFRLASSNGGSLAHADSSSSGNYAPPYDGYPGFAPGYLTELHNLMTGNPSAFKSGDILDGDAEAEGSSWWANNYGCGVQQGCTPCPALGSMTTANEPCSPVSEFNNFLQVMTTQENSDLSGLGISGVVTTVHSTDPGTATNQLSKATVQADGNLITIDAYPDENDTTGSQAVTDWQNQLSSVYNYWTGQGISSPQILVGEWGYSNTMNVSDSAQESVIAAETNTSTGAFNESYLDGTNYWVGPGSSTAGGYTYIMEQDSGGNWVDRPAVTDVSGFYAAKNGTGSGISYRASLTGNSGGTSSSSQTVTLPTGWAAGDLTVIAGRIGTTGATFTTPSGWTPISSGSDTPGGFSYAFYYRVLQAGDTSPVIRASKSSTWEWASDGVSPASGHTLSADGTPPAASVTSSAGTAVTYPSASAAAAGDASLLVTAGRASTNNGSSYTTSWTAPSLWTAGSYQEYSSNMARLAATAYRTGLPSGSIAPASGTFTDSLNDSFYFASVNVLVKSS